MMARTINPEVGNITEKACIVECKTSSIKGTGKNYIKQVFS